jgi:hypothetical protein
MKGETSAFPVDRPEPLDESTSQNGRLTHLQIGWLWLHSSCLHMEVPPEEAILNVS